MVKGLPNLRAATKAALSAKKLLKIYNVAVKSRLDMVIPEALDVALKWVRSDRNTEMVRSVHQRLPTKEIREESFNELQRRLVHPDVFNIVLPEISISDARPSALFGPDKKAHPITDVLAIKAGMNFATFNGLVTPFFAVGTVRLGLGTSLGALFAGASLAANAAVYRIDRTVSYQNHIRKLVSAASAILLLERVFWLGGQRPSLNVLTRGAVRGIHLMPQLAEFAESEFQKNSSLFGTEEEVRIFREMVGRFRFDYVRELEEDGNLENYDVSKGDQGDKRMVENEAGYHELVKAQVGMKGLEIRASD